MSLLHTLPEKVSFIFGEIDHELSYSKNTDKYEVIRSITPFQTELSQDGFLEFGFIYHDKEILSEIFIKNAKYIQVWGISKSSFRETMKEFSLHEIEDLNFIDEYPMVTESLSVAIPESISTLDIITSLKKIFIE